MDRINNDVVLLVIKCYRSNLNSRSGVRCRKWYEVCRPPFVFTKRVEVYLHQFNLVPHTRQFVWDGVRLDPVQ